MPVAKVIPVLLLAGLAAYDNSMKGSLSMATLPVDGFTVSFDAQERAAAELIGRACSRSSQLIHECWGLPTPQDLHVYVATSWLRTVFWSAPWSWRVPLGLTLPLWYSRTQKLWQSAGGWAQTYGMRRTVMLKPPRLMAQGDSSIGDRVFIPEKDTDRKVERVACHELVHAFTSHLRLPVWLHEGLAMVTVDTFAGKPTVKQETVTALASSQGRQSPQASGRLNLKDPDAVVYLYVRGYWITHYLEETRPGLLKSLLVQRFSHRELEGRLASAYGMGQEEFWRTIDALVYAGRMGG